MRLTWLIEPVDQIWDGAKVALEDANWLASRGHQVTVLSRSAAPTWLQLHCQFRQVTNFRPANLPAGDVLIGTHWLLIPFIANAGAGRGMPVHFCQGYEGDFPGNAQLCDRIEAAYRLPRVRHIATSKNLAQQLRQHFGIEARTVPFVVNHSVHFPAPSRPIKDPLRVGLFGPWQMTWKDIRTGIEACKLVGRAGLEIQLVRVTNTQPERQELLLPFPVEWHERVAPQAMGDIYRSLDIFLGTSSGIEEGPFLPAAEAMACGVPCVLTDAPCFRAFGEGQFAMFVPPQDHAAMAEALVVAGRIDEVRTALREAGIAVAQNFTQQAHGINLEQALLAIALEGRNCPRAIVREQAIATESPHDSEAGDPAAPARTTPATPATIAAAIHVGDTEQLEQKLMQTLLAAVDSLLSHSEIARASRCYAAARCLQGTSTPAGSGTWPDHQNADHESILKKLEALAAAGINDPGLHNQCGQLLHECGRHADAVKAFRAAIAAGSNNAGAYNDLGVALFESGDTTGARANFERALVLEPDYQDATDNLRDIKGFSKA
ncbi:hypothetical protein LBMAG49_16010 [Planctomycetota bacterium]|nr:hypothetical protein LBMAG49_16010 [Planctomycetota bacterium]